MSALVSPARGQVTSGYGPRKAKVPGMSTFHKGTDVARAGLAIVVPADGNVIANSYNAARGNYVKIDHGGGVVTLHQHLAKRSALAVGSLVRCNAPIGTMGKTGLVTGVHLHTEVQVNGATVDPAQWYAARGVQLGTDQQGKYNLPTPSLPVKDGSKVLRRGMYNSAEALSLQEQLWAHFPAYAKTVAKPYRGKKLTPDGDFGGQTEAWVMEFQRRTSLVPDGIVGPLTRAKLAEYGITF